MTYSERFPPTIMDIEASGFGYDSYPIEVGLVDQNQERYCSLIQPMPQWTHWSEDAEKAHGISRDSLLRYGQPARQVAIELNRRLQGRTLYSDGWVVDHPWLMTLFRAVRIEPEFRLSPIEIILNEDQIEHWDSTRQGVLQSEQIRRHRASNDAWIIQQTWIRCRARQLQTALTG